jgi:hypothetical protein
MYYYVYNGVGFFQGMTETKPEHDNWTNTPNTYSFVIEKWNGSAWVEGATPEEIAEANKALVPLSVSRMGLKIQLLLKGIEIVDIIETINSIPSSMFPDVQKQIAIIKFEEAAYFDRYNADLQLVAVLMGLTQEDLDDIFINGNKV